MRELKIKDSFYNELHCYVWEKVENVKGVVQILHGVNEHGLRYIEFAEYLNRNGYVVYLTEHLSQGLSRTSKDGEVVDFGKSGQLKLIDGMNKTRALIKEEYKNQKIYAVGHSLGALIIRNYLLYNKNEYEKIILTGSGLSSVKGLGGFMFFGGIISMFKGNKPSKLFDGLFRKTQLRLNEKVEINHFIEWLTRDEELTEINKKDQYLFIRLSVNSFMSLLKLVKNANNMNNIRDKYSDNINMLVLSGTHDPSTEFGEGTRLLYEYLREIGLKGSMRLYPEARHDLLQETNRKEVFKDILEFMVK
jgi:alpha-beta hydrolase superfamily lysophospholipase